MSKDSEKKVSFNVDKVLLNKFTSELAKYGIKTSQGLRASMRLVVYDSEVRAKVIAAHQKGKK